VEGVLCPIIQVINENAEKDWTRIDSWGKIFVKEINLKAVESSVKIAYT